MEYITLKNSDLKVSRLCMGGCPMGGHGWGNVSEDNLIRAVQTAIYQGVNFFDNADTYGLGKSEELLGKAIRGNRDKVVIASKFGVRVENGKTTYDNSPDWIEESITGSLKRLGVDYIDLYQIHYRDNKTNINTVIDKLEELKSKGYIRYYGLSNIHEEDKAELYSHVGKFVSFQDEYSLATRKNEKDLINLSNDLELSPLTWGSLGQGILTGKYNSDVKFSSQDRRSREVYVNFHGDQLKKNLKIVDVMKGISHQTSKSVPSIALRFILDYIPNSVVLAGIKNTSQLLSNLEAMDWNLSGDQINDLLKISEDKVGAN